jgi:hypothetical protein
VPSSASEQTTGAASPIFPAGSPAVSAPPFGPVTREPITVLGMALGQPFRLPPCSGASDLDAMTSSYTCWTSSTIDPDTKRVWYKGDVPIAKSIWAKIHAGVLDALDLDTLGIKSQEYSISLLKEKFGEPARFEEVPYQNSYGAKFIVYEADWHTPDVHVHFDAAHLGKLNEGWVQIQTPRAYDEMSKKLDEAWRNRGKL